MYATTAHADLELEYTPSLHSKRFQLSDQPAEAVIEHFIKLGKEVTKRAKQTYKLRENVRYGGINDNQILDIYYAQHEHSTPIFVYIHGGYWTSLEKSSAGVLVPPLIESGYRVIVVDYNLCPFITLEELCQQIQNFFKWVISYATDTRAKWISVCGHSAGAHLSCQILLDKYWQMSRKCSIVRHLFLISGIYDLRELQHLSCCNANNILGLQSNHAFALSPMCWRYDVEVFENFKHALNIHILVAEHDSRTFIEQSRKFAEYLQLTTHLKVYFRIFSNYDHFDIIEEMAVAESNISLYIKEQLRYENLK